MKVDKSLVKQKDSAETKSKKVSAKKKKHVDFPGEISILDVDTVNGDTITLDMTKVGLFKNRTGPIDLFIDCVDHHMFWHKYPENKKKIYVFDGDDGSEGRFTVYSEGSTITRMLPNMQGLRGIVYALMGQTMTESEHLRLQARKEMKKIQQQVTRAGPSITIRDAVGSAAHMMNTIHGAASVGEASCEERDDITFTKRGKRRGYNATESRTPPASSFGLPKAKPKAAILVTWQSRTKSPFSFRDQKPVDENVETIDLNASSNFFAGTRIALDAEEQRAEARVSVASVDSNVTETPVTEGCHEKPETEPSSEKQFMEASSEEPTIETSPEEPAIETDPEEAATETGSEEPATETGLEEPAIETGPEEPAAETSPEEPMMDVRSEMPDSDRRRKGTSRAVKGLKRKKEKKRSGKSFKSFSKLLVLN